MTAAFHAPAPLCRTRRRRAGVCKARARVAPRASMRGDGEKPLWQAPAALLSMPITLVVNAGRRAREAIFRARAADAAGPLPPPDASIEDLVRADPEAAEAVLEGREPRPLGTRVEGKGEAVVPQEEKEHEQVLDLREKAAPIVGAASAAAVAASAAQAPASAGQPSASAAQGLASAGPASASAGPASVDIVDDIDALILADPLAAAAALGVDAAGVEFTIESLESLQTSDHLAGSVELEAPQASIVEDNVASVPNAEADVFVAAPTLKESVEVDDFSSAAVDAVACTVVGRVEEEVEDSGLGEYEVTEAPSMEGDVSVAPVEQADDVVTTEDISGMNLPISEEVDLADPEKSSVSEFERSEPALDLSSVDDVVSVPIAENSVAEEDIVFAESRTKLDSDEVAVGNASSIEDDSAASEIEARSDMVGEGVSNDLSASIGEVYVLEPLGVGLVKETTASKGLVGLDVEETVEEIAHVSVSETVTSETASDIESESDPKEAPAVAVPETIPTTTTETDEDDVGAPDTDSDDEYPLIDCGEEDECPIPGLADIEVGSNAAEAAPVVAVNAEMSSHVGEVDSRPISSQDSEELVVADLARGATDETGDRVALDEMTVDKVDTEKLETALSDDEDLQDSGVHVRGTPMPSDPSHVQGITTSPDLGVHIAPSAPEPAEGLVKEALAMEEATNDMAGDVGVSEGLGTFHVVSPVKELADRALSDLESLGDKSDVKRAAIESVLAMAEQEARPRGGRTRAEETRLQVSVLSQSGKDVRRGHDEDVEAHVAGYDTGVVTESGKKVDAEDPDALAVEETTYLNSSSADGDISEISGVRASSEARPLGVSP